MKIRNGLAAAAFSASLLLTAIAATAQNARPQRRFPVYDAAREITVDGTVEKLVSRPAAGSPLGLHLMIDTPRGTIDAHLGLLSEKQANQAGISPGAAVEMVGAMVQVGRKEVLAVRELTVGNRTLALRNERGIPRFQMAPRDSSGKIILRRGQQ